MSNRIIWPTLWLAPIFLLSFALHFSTAILSEGPGNGVNYELVLLPTFHLFQKIFGIKHLNPYSLTLVGKGIASILSFLSMMILVASTSSFFQTKRYQLFYVILSQFLWFIPYSMSFPSVENICFILFSLGLSLGIMQVLKQGSGPIWILIGLLMGASALVFPDWGISVLFFGVWIFFFREIPLRVFLFWITGCTIAWFSFGPPLVAFSSFPVEALFENFLSVGRNMLESGLYILSLPLLFLVFYFWIFHSTHLLSWISFPFFCYEVTQKHGKMDHFIPLFFLTPLLVSLSLEQAGENFHFWKFRLGKFLLTGMILVNCILLAILPLRPTEDGFFLREYLEEHDFHDPSSILANKDERYRVSRDIPQAFEAKNEQCKFVYTRYPIFLDLMDYKLDFLIPRIMNPLYVLWVCPRKKLH